MYITRYNEELCVASIEKESLRENKVEDKIRSSSYNKKVLNVQYDNHARSAIIAYLLARYSRSADSIETILEEIRDKEGDAGLSRKSKERLEVMWYGYGHASVASPAMVNLNFENWTTYDAMRMFYTNQLMSGQHRSTRYQDFSEPKYEFEWFFKYVLKQPVSKHCVVTHQQQDLAIAYADIMEYAFKTYKELYEPTKQYLQHKYNVNVDDKNEAKILHARTLDCTRYLLPLGTLDSWGAVASARTWQDNIRLGLTGSNSELYQMIQKILLGEGFENTAYYPEIDTLVRHLEPTSNYHQECLNLLFGDGTTDEDGNANLGLFDYPLDNHDSVYSQFGDLDDHSYVFMHENRSSEFALINNLFNLAYPNLNSVEVENHFHKESFTYITKILGKMLSNYFNRHIPMGNLFQSEAMMFDVFTSVGTIKDLVRHNSISRFVPLFEDEIDMSLELDRESLEDYYCICPYITPDTTPLTNDYRLHELYHEKMHIYYDKVLDFHRALKDYFVNQNHNLLAVINPSQNPANHIIKYVLPHGHVTKATFGFSLDKLNYFIDTRTKPEGHIAYRKLSESICKTLMANDRLGMFTSLFDKVKVDINNRNDFLNRS